MRQKFTITGNVVAIEPIKSSTMANGMGIKTQQVAIAQHDAMMRDEPTWFQFKNERTIPIMELQVGDSVSIEFNIVSNSRAHSRFNNLHGIKITRI